MAWGGIMRRVHVWLVAAAAMGVVLLGVLMLPPAGLAAAAAHTGHGKPAAHVRAAVSARGRVAPQALLHHSTSPRPRSAAGKRAQARRPGAVPAQVGPDLGAPLPLGSLP